MCLFGSCPSLSVPLAFWQPSASVVLVIGTCAAAQQASSRLPLFPRLLPARPKRFSRFDSGHGATLVAHLRHAMALHAVVSLHAPWALMRCMTAQRAGESWSRCPVAQEAVGANSERWGEAMLPIGFRQKGQPVRKRLPPCGWPEGYSRVRLRDLQLQKAASCLLTVMCGPCL